MIKLSIAMALVTTLLSGCSSSLKKTCQSTNWYERGVKVAKEGKYPDSDFFVNKCKSAGAVVNHQQLDSGFKSEKNKFCQSDLAYKNGLNGEKFDFTLCRDFGESNLRQAHLKGIKKYCSASSARSIGESGSEYKGICPSDLEPKFLSGYKVGFNNYLNKTIRSNNADIKALERKKDKLTSERNALKTKLSQNRGSYDDTVVGMMADKIRSLQFKLNDVEAEYNNRVDENKKLKLKLK